MRDDRPGALDRPEGLNRPEVPDQSRGLDPPGAPDRPGPVDLRREGSARSPTDLSRRLNSLPDGHPSSPYDTGGAPRQPSVRLRDLDTGPDEDTPRRDDDTSHPADVDRLDDTSRRADTGPDHARRPDEIRRYPDAEWADHVTEVRTRLDKAQADGLATDHQYAIDEDGETWVSSRREIHGMVIEDLYAKASDVPCEHKAIVAGGLTGAGKTTVLAGHAGIDRSQYLTINPDDIKEELAKRGLVPKVEGLSPMEASDLVHEESSHIAKQLAIRARADGKNLIWDITMATRASTERRIDDLRGSGYETIRGIFVDIPIEVSAKRADARHRHDQGAYEAGDGMGGRYVPPEVTAAQADQRWGSQNRRTFEELKPRFDQWTRFDNGVDDRVPIRIEGNSHDDNSEEISS